MPGQTPLFLNLPLIYYNNHWVIYIAASMRNTFREILPDFLYHS
jgi:hypothetical protein